MVNKIVLLAIVAFGQPTVTPAIHMLAPELFARDVPGRIVWGIAMIASKNAARNSKAPMQAVALKIGVTIGRLFNKRTLSFKQYSPLAIDVSIF